MSRIFGWGRYPQIDADVVVPASQRLAREAIGSRRTGVFIPRGMGRSYGDSALAECVLSSSRLQYLTEFDAASGRLTCEAGVTLDELLQVVVPRGWFLPVTPGTKFVSVGGSIASDVHGKNHHIDGCFSEFVESFILLLPDGGVAHVTRDAEPELFHATCGGMGLTGFIQSATLRLRPIRSAQIVQETYKAPTLEAALESFESGRSATYSVAWIDCLATGKQLGRSLVMFGEHASDGALAPGRRSSLTIPMDMPSLLLNRMSVSAFNTLYYHRVRQAKSSATMHYEPFFYPLDAINDWNRLYGKGGFTQYQFALPRDAGLPGLRAILTRIAQSGRGSFLAVLKAFGAENDNLLSFPMEGYTLALDFQIDNSLFPLLDELDAMVLDYGGRIYLTKDVRMHESTFKRSYPKWETFQAVRERIGAIGRISSLQSRRLGLDR